MPLDDYDDFDLDELESAIPLSRTRRKLIAFNRDDVDADLGSALAAIARSRLPERTVDPTRPAPVEGGGFAEAMKDLAVSAASGAGSLVKGVGAVGGMITGDIEGNALYSLGKNAEEYWNGLKSQRLKGAEQARAAKIREADGELQKGWTAVKETFSDARLLSSFFSQQLPNLVPGGIVGRALAVGTAGRLGAGAAVKVGTAGAIGTGAVLQGGDVGSGVYESVKDIRQIPDEVWDANPDFQKLLNAPGTTREEAKTAFALNAARQAGVAGGLLSLITNGLLPGGSAIEKFLVGGKVAATVAGKGSLGSAIKTGTKEGLKAGGGEAVAEAIEEAGGQFGANLAKREIDPNQSASAGMGEAAGLGALGGLGTGGAIGVASGARSGLTGTPETPVPETTPEPPEQIAAQVSAMLNPESGKDSVFVAAGNEDAIPGDLPDSVKIISRDEGTLLTTDVSKANAFSQTPEISDEFVAKILGIPEPKSAAMNGPNLRVVQARDENGDIVSEAITSDAGNGANEQAIASHVPPGGTVTTTGPEQAQAERALGIRQKPATPGFDDQEEVAGLLSDVPQMVEDDATVTQAPAPTAQTQAPAPTAERPNLATPDERYESLIAGLSRTAQRQGYGPIDRNSVTPLDIDAEPVLSKLAKALKQTFGVDTLLVDAPNGVRDVGGNEVVRFNGTALQDSATIVLNKSVVGSNYANIAFHELSHTMRRLYPELWQPMAEVAIARINKAAAEEHEQFLRDDGVESDDTILDETVAEVVGEQMGQPDFWTDAFAGKDKSFVDSVMAVVKQYLNKLTSALTGNGFVTAARDVEAVRKAIQTAFAQWEQQYAAQEQQDAVAQTAETGAAQPAESKTAQAPVIDKAASVDEVAVNEPVALEKRSDVEAQSANDESGLSTEERIRENSSGTLDKPKKSKPEDVRKDVDKQQGASTLETAEIAAEFDSVAEAATDDDFQIHHLFDAPAKNEIVRLEEKVRVYHAEHGWMTPAQAKKVVQQWKDHANAQGADRGKNDNPRKVVLSLFDLTGQWSQPWEDAGYNVFRFDIQNDSDGGDVNNFSVDFFNDWWGNFDGQDVYAILAACPCTDFASSGARHFAAKDADGRTRSSVELVEHTLRTIEYFKPSVWAVENPVGRIERLTGLPPWRLSFDPNHLGDPYTKKTLLWGRFNGDLPVAAVEPTEGSKMHSKYGGKSQATKNARSVTPEGFAYAFFMANNAVDHPAMAIASKYDRLDRKLIADAVAAGVTEEQINDAVEDFYYQDLDDDGANDAIRELIASTKQETESKPADLEKAEPVEEKKQPAAAPKEKPTKKAKPADVKKTPAVAQHIENGEAESATNEVIAKAIKKSAANTEMNLREAHADLLKQVDDALDALKGVPSYDGSGSEAFAAYKKAHEAWEASIPNKLTFEVPGDGKFTVRNRKDNLTEFRKKIADNKGFNPNSGKKGFTGRAFAVSSEPTASVKQMLEDGEKVAAYELAKVLGKPFRFTPHAKGGTPNLYAEWRTVDSMPYGINGFVGKLHGVKDASWTFIEERTGRTISSDGSYYSTQEAAVSAARTKLTKVGKDKALEVIESAATMDAAALEAEWLAAAEKSDQAVADELERTSEANAKRRQVEMEDLKLWKKVSGEDVKGMPDKSDSATVSKALDKAIDLGKLEDAIELIQRRFVPAYNPTLFADTIKYYRNEAKSPSFKPGDFIRKVASATVVTMTERDVKRVLEAPGADIIALANFIVENRPGLKVAVKKVAGELGYGPAWDGKYKKAGIASPKTEKTAPKEPRYARVTERLPVEVTGDEIDGGPNQSMKTLKDKAEAYALKHFANKVITVKSDGAKIIISPRGIRKAYNNAVSRLAAVAGTKLDQIIERSVFVDSQPDRKGRTEIKAVHHYDSLISVGEQIHVIRMVVREASDGKRYYDHFEAGRTASGSELSSESGPAPTHSDLYPEADAVQDGTDGNLPQNDDRIRFARQKPPVFYSQLQRAVESASPKLDNTSGAQWKGWLNSNAPKLGVKVDEIKWSGINEYFDLMAKEKLTRAQIAEFIAQNGVKVEEVEKGNRGEDQWREESDDTPTAPESSVTKYGQYALPGGENYRELLLTLPMKSTVEPRGEVVMDGKDERYPYAVMIEGREYNRTSDWQVAQEELQDGLRKARDRLAKGDNYGSKHWQEKNVVAHIRFNDRTDADGKRVLFIEELQSDWAQEGKKKGFTEKTPDELQRRFSAANQRVMSLADELQNAPDRYDAIMPKLEAAQLEQNEARAELNEKRDALPAAPFVADTKSWLALGIKRMIRYAVDGGYDKVAFVNGKQSADRYSLSKRVKEIAYDPTLDGGTLIADTVDQGPAHGPAINEINVSVEKLADYIGKEAAERIMNNPTERDGEMRVLRGIDLEVGGEGMKTFYDRIVPQVVNDVLKKVGGGKMGPVMVTTDTNLTSGMQYTGPIPTIEALQRVITENDDRNPVEVFRQAREVIREIDTGTDPVESMERFGSPLLAHTVGGWMDSRRPQPKPQLGFEITPQLRENAQTGMPLFARQKPIKGKRFTLPEFTDFQRFREAVQDKDNRVKAVQEAVVAQKGRMDDGSNVYRAMERFNGIAASMLDRFNKYTVKGLMNDIGKSGVEMDDLALYLYARHAEERNNYINSINPHLANSNVLDRNGSGMSTREARKLLQAFRADPNFAKFDGFAKRLDAVLKDSRKLMIESGLVDPATAAAWTREYKNYVPLKGFENIDEHNEHAGLGRGYDLRGPEHRRALGRESKAGQIVENILKDHERAIVRSEKNKVGRTFLKFVRQNKDEKLWSVNQMVLKPHYQKSSGSVLYRLEKMDDKERTIVVKEKGKEYAIVINDPVLHRQLVGQDGLVNYNGTGASVFRAWTSINRFLAKMWTALNPVFIGINFARDAMTAAIHGTAAMGPKFAAKVAKYTFPAMAGIIETDRSVTAVTVPTNGPKTWPEWYVQYQMDGGKAGFYQFEDMEARQKELQNLITAAQHAQAGGLKAAWEASSRYTKAVHDFIMDINGGIENASRVAAYRAAIEAGKGRAEASSLAKNLTVNFNRRGVLTPLLGSIWLFFNPAVQGSVRIAQAIRSNPKAMGAMVGGLIGLGFFLGIMGAQDKDDEDTPYWDKDVRDFEKQKSMVYMLGGGDRVNIPMPYGHGWFVHVGYALADISRGASLTAKGFELFNSFMKHYSPIDQANVFDSNNVALLFAPTAIAPFVEHGSNVRANGQPLRPDDSKFGGPPVPDSERYWGTSYGTLLQRITDALNDSGGGTSSVPGSIAGISTSYSPEVIKNYISGYTGGLGTFLFDSVNSVATIYNLGFDASVDQGTLPFVKQFYKVDNSRGDTSYFMENSKKALQALDEAKHYYNSENPAVMERIDRNAGLTKLGAAVGGLMRVNSDLRKAEIEIKRPDNGMLVTERHDALKALDQEKRRIMQEWNGRFYRTERGED